MAFLKTQERTNGDVRTPYESGTSPAWASGVRHLRIPALTGANACESVHVEIISLHLHRNFGSSVLRSSFLHQCVSPQTTPRPSQLRIPPSKPVISLASASTRTALSPTVIAFAVASPLRQALKKYSKLGSDS
jgi:hypothetical protein